MPAMDPQPTDLGRRHLARIGRDDAPTLTLDRLARQLAARRRGLPAITRRSLEEAGILGRRAPRRFRTNFGKTFRLTPAYWARPRTHDQLRRVVAFAYQQGLPIKPIGSLCTWSPAARPEDRGIALLTDRLAGVRQPDLSLLKPDRLAPSAQPGPVLEGEQLVAPGRLVQVMAGTTIWDLNEALREWGLALKTMGAYGGERVGGAFSTGTHGSSGWFGPMCDSVASLDLVWQGVSARVEPADGPTDPVAFGQCAAHREWVLVQDDEIFHAARLGYGMLGVAASYLIDVGPLYYLEERRREIGRAAARREIREVAAGMPGNALRRTLGVEYYLNLHSRRARPLAIRVERSLIAAPPALQRRRRSFDELLFRGLRALGVDPGRLFGALFRTVPRLAPALLEWSLAGLEGTFRSHSDRVYNMGAANLVGTLVQEIGIPAQYVDAYLDDCTALARRLFEDEGMVLTAPIGVRFVRPSRALLAVQQPSFTDGSGRERPVTLWAMVNFALVLGTPNGIELLRRFHAAAMKYAGRSHPGKCFFDDYDRLRRCYDLGRFRRIRSVVDPDGCFLNAWNREVLRLTETRAA